MSQRSQGQTRSHFRILVASDIHIGYGEKDEIRGEDSFKAFEEILQLAKSEKVDLVLLAGDLFHDNKPSPKCMLRCTETLRKYCLGDGEIEFQVISDQKENFSHTKYFPYVNYEEQNLNVSLPVFSIHGNHDDPTGKNPICFLETLSASGLINYFGKYMDMDGFEVRPLLLKKGDTHIAMYGLGSLPEERLHRFFLQKKIAFLRPEEQTEKWFNLFIVHQNRVAHGTKYMPERFLTNLPHLVIWGHEHESKPELDYNSEMGFHVFQPGSSVATSLCQAESAPKHVAILEVVWDPDSGTNQFQMTPVALKTPRQFIFDSVDLEEDLPGVKDASQIENFCEEKVNSMISEARIAHSGDERQPKLPLIRLRVDSNSAQPFSVYRFGLKFKGRVANPSDIILFKLKRRTKGTTGANDCIDNMKLNQLSDGTSGENISNIEDIVSDYFKDVDDKSQLNMLSEKGVTIAVREMVEKEIPDSIKDVLEGMLQDTRTHLMQTAAATLSGGAEDKNELISLIKEYREQQKTRETEDIKKYLAAAYKISSNKGSRDISGGGDESDDVQMVSDDDEDHHSPPPKVSRGRGGGRGSRGTRGRK